jgi:hypothetical protein
MKQIIKRILREQVQSPDYLEKVSRILDVPYFQELENYGIINRTDQLKVLKYIYGNGITINDYDIYDYKGNMIYYEDSDGGYERWEYDSNGKVIFYDNNTDERYRNGYYD